ncbi:MAG TPA: GAF domain-containing sensor histidine kinase [Ktedonobacteraceae bacterium]|nr:GAF domain-containing sensor histidine kinase [Ktedonobacteraceae bacterium]
MAEQIPDHAEYPFISPLHSMLSGTPLALLKKIARHTVELLGLEDCAIGLLDAQGISLVFLALAQEDVSTEPVSVPLHMSPLADILAKRELLILEHMGVDAHMQALGENALRTLACLPLLDQEHLLGVLIASATTSAPFALEKLPLLSLLAEQATLVLLNARQAELVRDANRVKTNFISLVTHELRSPFNAINGYLDLTLQGMAGELNEQQREFLQRARAGSEHLYALMEDLLLAARSDAGQLRLNREPAALYDIVRAALEELELTASDAEVALEADVPADLPTLLVDTVRLQQVLRNLLSNALHFTPAGGRVTVAARLVSTEEAEQQKRVEIRVIDTGCGIAPGYHQRIFERFFQVPRLESGRANGQGLGLAIVKMIVELHGGHVRVESVPGKGSTFICTLDA